MKRGQVESVREEQGIIPKPEIKCHEYWVAKFILTFVIESVVEKQTSSSGDQILHG